jgi:DNA invertase Pin-like site-specific DNA recombinase
MKRVRCAIYTRKSTEDGLEQEFNSLDAQREACEAYILSQKHEGWELLPTTYEDGGYSGGNMERPGLKALLAEVDGARVEVIVVYKVDRLTRSLADFAKIVERLDAREASFVSVTQAFNTTTSMGRLTLNVLLSFAQFEREVTGERIRDKIAASKKKGLWMGGPVPLGYQVIERKLVPVPEEAERVRTIMRRYIESTSANALIAELEVEGLFTKVQHRTSGPHRGGIPFRRGSLFHLLKNRIYRGMIVHKGRAYAGEHQPIVEEDLWGAVQAKLAEKAPPRKRPTNGEQDAVLKGLLNDPHGRPMVPTFTCKGTRRYRYYETRRDLTGPGKPEATRFAMRQLDRHVIEHLLQLLKDEHSVRRLSGVSDGAGLQKMFAKASGWAAELRQRQPSLRQLVPSITVASDCIELLLDPDALGVRETGECWRHKMDLPAKRPFREAKVRIDTASGAAGDRDQPLVKLLQEAKEAQELVMGSAGTSLNHIARRENRCRKRMARLLRVSWLSPRLVETILEGRQPARLSRKWLLQVDLPIDWSEQERLLGFVG